MDGDSIVGITALAYAAKQLVGPSFELYGQHIREWQERNFFKRVSNVERIIRVAERTLGDDLQQPGEISPRVWNEIFEEGSLFDDVLAAQYFGGVLASSRSERIRDDRGAVIAKLITRLSFYQIRLHYILYREFKKMWDGTNYSITSGNIDLSLLISFDELSAAMELTREELASGAFLHALLGLMRESLVGPFATSGYIGTVLSEPKMGEQMVVSVAPTGLGAEVYMFAFGHGNIGANALLQSDVEIVPEFEELKEIHELRGTRIHSEAVEEAGEIGRLRREAEHHAALEASRTQQRG